ncbi:hypothetical protein C0J52_22620 [Blattella germanica]|nr:hypothetical protein C0J52_22620 [Blattella germanica]
MDGQDLRFQRILQNSPINVFKEIKEKLPELDSTHQEIVLECLSVRQKDIQNILFQEKCAISGPVLQDFDWKVKWVMGSSKSSSLREPLLSLDLHLSEGRNLRKNGIGINKKTVSLELDKEELNKLISILEKAQETVANFQN